MEKKAKVPKLRFPGFTDAWEQRKLDLITDVRDGTHASPQYVVDGHPFVTSKNVKEGYINYDDIQFISDLDFEEINKRSKVDINDILMGMIGTIGNIAIVRENPDFAIKNVALIKDTGDVFYRYLYYCLQSKKVVNQLSENLDGGTQKFIALNKVRNLNIPLPSKKEQHKIGNYFENLDNLITLHQRKLTHLQAKKKSLLQKMFPKKGECFPELRFPGFTDAWEQRKLSDETNSIDTGKSKFTAKENGIYEILGSTSVIGYGDSYDYEGDFLLTARVGANAGELYRHSGKVKISDNTVFIQGGNLDFTFYKLLNFDIKRLSFGTGQPLVKASELKQLELLSPISNEEKAQIGDFFAKLDNLITLHQRKLTHLQTQKKALLQQMFV
ncbi:restriction endonuclease subunit S [Pectinatus frisingensis]|uniref:restriction endonuclease subunit S n=1 Tax=Pectinatus frisingensis TaxID=865 RepID=UPI0018C57597|nr:restriction endonuclease subunit S [Pectinatus frisingensis]